MLRKFLIVGLGGSGGKTLRFLRAELLRWLESVGWDEGMPDGWQLLHIDSPTQQDGAEITEVPMLPADNYRGLVGAGITFETIDRVLVGAAAANPADMSSYRVDPVHLNVPVTEGAGQYRAVGRAIGLAYADVIMAALRGAKTRVMDARATAQLSDISVRAGLGVGGASGDPICIVISSLAGGTGAGLVIDTCDLLRQLDTAGDTWGDKSFGFLYCSDVFGSVNPMSAGGIAPNTMAAASEFLNGYWLTGSFDRTNAMLAAKGANNPVDRSGPAYPYLVGATSPGGLSFGNQTDLYRMMGRALSSWVTDAAIQSRVVAYEATNWLQGAAELRAKPDVPWRGHDGVFSAFGYAELNLGTDRFEDYATTRIARVAADWLREAHLIRARAADPDVSTPPDVIVEEMAHDELIPFLRDAQLFERGKDNQVIDALVPEASDGLYAKQLANLTSLVKTGKSKMSATAWANEISLHLPTVADEYDREYDEGMRGRAGVWVDEAPKRIVDAVNRMLCRVGFAVTERTLALARDEMTSVMEELQAEAGDHHRWAADYRSAIQAQLDFSGSAEPTNPKIDAAIEEGLWTKAGYDAEAKRRFLAIGLLRDFVSGVIVPLGKAVTAARANLELKGYGGDGSTPLILSWPERAVPDHMVPPKNELLVISADRFPERFDYLITRSTKAEFDVEQMVEYRTEVISGAFMDEIDPRLLKAPRPVAVQGRWRPDPTLLLGAADMKTPAEFKMNFLPDDLVARARQWLRRNGSASQRFLDQDLRSYLAEDADPDPAERNDRRSAFNVAFQTALRTAEPLVRINAGIKAQLHPNADADGARVVPSQIPLRDHPLEDDVREIVNSVMGPGSADKAVDLTTTPGVTRISISSTLGAPHDPMVFSSIFEPIAASWSAAATNPVDREAFWNARRARPIAEFVPASQELILAMTRGWFTGRMLGLIDREGLRITDGDGIYPFPNPLLTLAAPNSRDLLPAVLESMILAHSQVVVQGIKTPLEAYIALRNLGKAANTTEGPEGLHRYSAPSPVLGEWVRSGQSPTPLSKPMLNIEELRQSSRAERIEALTRTMQTSLAAYREEDEKFRREAIGDPGRYRPRDGNLRYGMMKHIITALQDLLDVNYGTGGDDDEDVA